MRGDFSRWSFDEQSNSAGVLQQQGRVLTDADWNDGARLAERWQLETARAVLGARVAAIPQDDPDALKVVAATLSGGEITVALNPGKVWAGGMLAYLRASGAAAGPERRIATYLDKPSDGQAPGAAGTRDAVVLELRRDALSGFQVPQRLIEPALGGVDTTARIWHGLGLRLLRLEPGEHCDDLHDRLDDDIATRRRLTVRLAPTQVTAQPCPTVVGGGYSGFEHDLYRVEIAQVADGVPSFKWSRFNGGLVGRGTFNADPAVRKLTIQANRQPIMRSGLQRFYLEAYEPLPARPAQAPADPERTADLAEEWRLVFGAHAVLASDGEIDLPADGVRFGAIPATPGRRVFFRLWDDIRPLADFDGPDPVELRDGIQLEFQGSGRSRPGDYWTFPVRAGDVGNPDTLVDDRPPEGPPTVRVPLGVLSWGGAIQISSAKFEIEDCRKAFPPLTELPPGCCVAVAPGEDIARALRRLRRAGGGCLCLLPGEHLLRESLDLSRAASICIEGFGLASRLVTAPTLAGPVFQLDQAQDIAFRSFAIAQLGQGAVFSCAATSGLRIEGMVVVSPVTAAARAPVEIRDIQCSGWSIKDSVLVGTSCVTGHRLSASTIDGNRAFGLRDGIRLSDMLDVTVAANRIAGVGIGDHGALQALLSGSSGEAVNRTPATRATALERQLDALERRGASDAKSRFSAIVAAGMFDVAIDANVLAGRYGVMGEIVDRSTITGNRIVTSAVGAGIGVAHDVRFSANRVGEPRDAAGSALSPRVGLSVLGDAFDLRVVDNQFLDVGDAIVFESDAKGHRAALRLAEVDFRAFPTDDADRSKEIVTAAKAEVSAKRASTRLLASSFAEIGRCERLLIEGNVVQADGGGVEWSGTKDVRDLRISRNAFVGCRGGAILIEPDDRVHYAYIAEAVDTQVRLIDRNRFDILGFAVRSTLGAVRVEKNDIRVRPQPVEFVALPAFVGVLTAQVFKAAPFAAAAAKSDIGNMRLGAKDNIASVLANPRLIDTGALAQQARTQIVANHAIDKGDKLTDNAFLLGKVALAGDHELVARMATAIIAPVLSDVEGFVVNLSGLQNEFTDNNLLSKNANLDGGVVLQMPSGTVTGNEVEAGQVGLMVTAKIGQGRRDLRIEGNRLNVTGPARGDGAHQAAYALAIPTLTAGNYSILDNELTGSVMIGADPFAALGLVKKGTIQRAPKYAQAHMLALDGKSLASANARAAAPAKDAIATPVLNVLLDLAVLFVPDPFNLDPHRDRAVIQFSDNRVVRGYVALAGSAGGAFASTADLRGNPAAAPVIQVTGNVLDYWARVVAGDVILTGNHSQTPIQHRTGGRLEQVANMPPPVNF